MSILLLEQVEKARARAADLDLPGLAAMPSDALPRDVAPPEQLAQRRRFLDESLGDLSDAKVAFERIIGGDELQPVNYLEIGALAARPVCRIDMMDAAGRHYGWATGFLIAPQLLLTNHHVLPSPALTARSVAEFDVELDVLGEAKASHRFRLDPARFFYTSDRLDFSVVAVAPAAEDGKRLADYDFLPLIGTPGKAIEGEWLTIIQHPAGKQKQVCVRENRLLKCDAEVLWYSTDTLGGSSGAPVYNNEWQVVALHHAGVPEKTSDGLWLTLDGRAYPPGEAPEDQVKWIANEGVRASRIVERLKSEHPTEALLEPVFAMTPGRARRLTQDRLAALPASPPPATPAAATRSASAMTRSITLTLDIADDGQVTVRPGSAGLIEAALERSRSLARRSPPRPAPIDVPFDADYANRAGYDPAFLAGAGAGFVVPLPVLGADLERDAEPLLDSDEYELRYDGYSVVMHAERRLAIYTAANVDGGHRFALGRPADEWRYDPRISRAVQLGNFYYQNNKFDRGHLTRREDMEYGASPRAAVARAADTLHWTNCTPQHSGFNQSKELWQGLERHILEDSLEAEVFAAQVFTGPILDEGDPTWDRFPDIQYPNRFWKVATAVTSSGRLFAAGFILDQSEVIAQQGIEAAVEVPFGAFKTFQVPISEIEQLTDLTFPCAEPGGADFLREVDPLHGPHGRRRAARVRARTRARDTEAFDLVENAPEGYVLLQDAASIIR
jgi:endonuclease G